MIDIGLRLKPFSVVAGSECLIPGTWQSVRAFPDRIEIAGQVIALPGDPFSLSFSLHQDLENNCIWVFGKNFKVQIKACPEGIVIYLPGCEHKILGDFGFCRPTRFERLFLGVTKAQDWDLMQRRADLKELLPILYFLGQKTPVVQAAEESNIVERKLESLFFANKRSDQQEAFQKLLSFFYENVQHVCFPKVSVLTAMVRFIRSMFVLEKCEEICIFPNNPFPSGRFLGIDLDLAVVDLQWSNSVLRQLVVHPKKEGKVLFSFPKKIKSFRVKSQLNCKGTVQKSDSFLQIEKGKTLYIDRFYPED